MRSFLLKTAVTFGLAIWFSGFAWAHPDHEHVDEAPVEVPAGYALGDPNSPVTVYEFASVTCGHCKHFHEDIMPILKSEYVNTGKVRFEFRPYALNQLDTAIYALTECTPEDDFFEITDEVFANQDALIENANSGTALSYLLPLAEKHGLSGEEALMACINDTNMKQTLLASMESADAFGVTGTPSLIINGALKRADSDLKDPDKFRAYMDRIVAAATITVPTASESDYQLDSN